MLGGLQKPPSEIRDFPGSANVNPLKQKERPKRKINLEKYLNGSAKTEEQPFHKIKSHGGAV